LLNFAVGADVSLLLNFAVGADVSLLLNFAVGADVSLLLNFALMLNVAVGRCSGIVYDFNISGFHIVVFIILSKKMVRISSNTTR
jgi:hypothetical protein